MDRRLCMSIGVILVFTFTVVSFQVLSYIELLNSQGTKSLTEGIEFPIPPQSPMPEALREYLAQSLFGNNP
ncbi:MAG: hypothetical protein P9M06_07145 [Candidatus Saelkia tenebricola]|nr:hypothetical protein [Candidatus Saelkia tenebricola]